MVESPLSRELLVQANVETLAERGARFATSYLVAIAHTMPPVSQSCNVCSFGELGILKNWRAFEAQDIPYRKKIGVSVFHPTRDWSATAIEFVKIDD